MLDHRFDLLGSGPVEVAYGAACAGYCGHRYGPGAPVAPDGGGLWLDAHVNRSNRDEARRLWRLVGDDDYRPIDWQLDFRSGYRWRGAAHIVELSVPVDAGADVKVPWELGRLQHLPHLALCAIVAAEGGKGFAPAERYVREVRCQLLDFMALNPPRFGVNWLCPMDVGIRIANMLVAVDLLEGAGLGLDGEVRDAVMRSARDHAAHIVGHLEYSETGRSNHYLADLVGVLWAASYLPAEPVADAWFALAARELIADGMLQFLDDGGNYEGSTNYHRLSGELVLYGAALLCGLDGDRLARLDNASPRAVTVRPPFPRGPLPRYRHADGGESLVPPELLDRLYRAGRMAAAVRRPDGRSVQVGDTDSGRLFRLDPGEEPLNHGGFIAAVAALFGETPTHVDGVVARRLAGRELAGVEIAPVADHGDLDAAIARIEALPDSCRHLRRIALTPPIPSSAEPEAWRRYAFPSFGLYVFRAGEAMVVFRCAPPPHPQAPLGHTHDDNLGIEYVLGEARRLDPGTVAYSPSRVLRDRYRAAGAHDVPRAVGWDVAPPGRLLFDLRHAAWATCCAWSPFGVAGEIAAPQGTLYRALRFAGNSLEIWDGVSPPNRLRPVSDGPAPGNGYGRTA